MRVKICSKVQGFIYLELEIVIKQLEGMFFPHIQKVHHDINYPLKSLDLACLEFNLKQGNEAIHCCCVYE